MRRSTLAFLAVAALLASACTPAAPPPPDMAALSAISDKIGQDYMKAYAAKDAAAIGNLFTEDAVEMPGDTVSLVGRAAIQAASEAEFKNPGPPATLVIKGSAISGTADMVVSEGTYSVSIPMPKGDPYVMNGKWISVSERQADSTWKMKRLIHNLNTAARPPMPPPAAAGT
jgi:uncharacterized protein (TIGR02246 family)